MRVQSPSHDAATHNILAVGTLAPFPLCHFSPYSHLSVLPAKMHPICSPLSVPTASKVLPLLVLILLADAVLRVRAAERTLRSPEYIPSLPPIWLHQFDRDSEQPHLQYHTLHRDDAFPTTAFARILAHNAVESPAQANEGKYALSRMSKTLMRRDAFGGLRWRVRASSPGM